MHNKPVEVSSKQKNYKHSCIPNLCKSFRYWIKFMGSKSLIFFKKVKTYNITLFVPLKFFNIYLNYQCIWCFHVKDYQLLNFKNIEDFFSCGFFYGKMYWFCQDFKIKINVFNILPEFDRAQIKLN